MIGHEFDGGRRDHIKEVLELSLCLVHLYGDLFFLCHVILPFSLIRYNPLCCRRISVVVINDGIRRLDTKVPCEDTFRVVFVGSAAVESLLVYAFLDTIEQRKGLLVRFISEPYNEQKLPGCAHLYLDIIKERFVFQKQFAYLSVRFVIEPLVKVQFVVIKVLPRIYADDLEIWLRGKECHQVFYFLRNGDSGQHRNVRRGHHIEHDLAVSVCLYAVPRKAFYA